MATGVLCCCGPAVLLLTSTTHFSSTPWFYVLFLLFKHFCSLSQLSSFLSLCFFGLFRSHFLSSVPFSLFLLFGLGFPHSSLSLLFPIPTPSQVSECNWPSRQAPSLHNLFAVCKNMHNWLKQNPKNVCVITCSVRKWSCSSPSHILFSLVVLNLGRSGADL